MKLPLQLGDILIQPQESLRVLGLFLDPRLNWTQHIQAINTKMAFQINALARLSGSTWGLPLQECRLIYNTVILPAMAYACHIWHQPTLPQGHPCGPGVKLEPIHRQCLRIISGGFRATPMHALETNTNVPPLDLILTARTVAYRLAAEDSDLDVALQGHCLRAHLSLSDTARPRHTWNQLEPLVRHPKPLPREWFRNWIGPEPANGSLGTRARIKQATQTHWLQRWTLQTAQYPPNYRSPPGKQAIQAHQHLRKAQSSLLTQIRTGKIGLARFLYNQRVPGHTNPACLCGAPKQTPAHVTLFCSLHEDHRHELLLNNTLDYTRLLRTAQGAYLLTKWWLQRRILPQFHLANDLLPDLHMDTTPYTTTS